jgi:enamine deaminase RidA (YjgF/YER057c/UK114 family)
MEGASMTLELINPAELSVPTSYSQVAVATGSRLVFVAGQVADDRHGDLVGPGDLTVQARQAFANVGRALAAVGARPDQVARITIYVVPHRPEYLPVISEARIAVFGDHKPTDVVLGVEALAHPELLIEVDAIAVVD